MSKNLDKAVAERNLLDSKLKLIEQKTSQHETSPLSQAACSMYYDQVEPMTALLDDIHTRILQVNPADIDTHTGVYSDLATRIFSERCTLATIKATFPSAQPSPRLISKPTVSMPNIDLPVFSGKYDEWMAFKSIYEAVIHNSQLPEVQKFHYLRTKVQGEALSLISNLPMTEVHYSEAWAILNSRYHNEREIVKAQVRRLLSLSQVKNSNPQHIQSLLDKTNECLAALKVLKQPTDKWDTLLVCITESKLDDETKKQWALHNKGTKMPSFKEVSDFVEEYVRTLHTIPSSSQKHQHNDTQHRERRASSHVISTATPSKCCINSCKAEYHPLFRCPVFLAMSVKERHQQASYNNLCFNCLKPAGKNHTADSCPSSSCRQCNKKHNTLLHQQRNTEYPANALPSSSQSQPKKKSSNIARDVNCVERDVLLATAVVKIQDRLSFFQNCRIMLDSCSQATLISESTVQRLGLERFHDNTIITGVGQTSAGSSKGKVKITLQSCVSSDRIQIEAVIMSKVTSDIPQDFCKTEYAHLNNLELADPKYFQPGPIDILLGADYTGLAMLDGQRKDGVGKPTAHKTKFGWVVMGQCELKQKQYSRASIHHVLSTTDKIVEKFWELEQVPKPKYLTEQERLCEENFVQTTTRSPSGKYVVSLPLNKNISKLGSSRDQAIRRWKSVERRLAKNKEYQTEYIKFMQEYIDLGHMISIPAGGGDVREVVGKTYYLPHHFIVRPDSSTTKFRVVFDASAKSITGLSLNDCMNVGATLQSDIFTLLLRFRKNTIAIKADVAKMFRQFLITEEQRDLQRIVWRPSPDDPIQDYQLQTVTYGTASAPFIATRCLIQLAEDNKHKYPMTANILEKDVYVDDLITSVNSEDDAMQVYQELNSIARSACLSFRKWSSTSSKLLDHIPEDLREKAQPFSFDKESDVKALGIHWNPTTDKFSFNPVQLDPNQKLTKRKVLSQLAKVFDPLGLLAPVTLLAKLFMQELWQCKLQWDENLSDELTSRWKQYCHNLDNISLIQIQRCVKPNNPSGLQLIAFSDASTKALGAVVYLRCKTATGGYTTSMLAAKSKVAPLKTVSLPRLELNGALLLTELLSQVTEALQLKCEVHAYTDSMIVLQWLASHPGKWQTFVANRVAKNQEVVPFQQWNHVKSEDNPADLVSRGVTARELSTSSLWWNGPLWLSQDPLPEKVIVNKRIVHEDMEAKVKTPMVNVIVVSSEHIKRFSSLNRLIRVTAWCIRFFNNMKNKKKQQPVSSHLPPLLCSEMTNAHNVIIRIVQQEEFTSELEALRQTKPVNNKSKLLSLNPFLDSDGVIRVGGRLQRADVDDYAKHPIIIPAYTHYTKLLINSSHLDHAHGGNKLIWCHLRTRYWIFNARNAIKFELRKCVKCRRHRGETMKQIMAPLPFPRVNLGRAFQSCGVDYAGPFNLRVMKIKSNKLYKAYFCIFVCMATKAVHLEPVGDLSTDAFLAALDRFAAIRGTPSSIHSDCGTNFVGADKELKQLFNSQAHKDHISNHGSAKGITWTFNSPGAPSHGGLWEAGVKSVKYHMKRVVGDRSLTYEEFDTILKRISSFLNSRPLCPITANPDDFDVLTPGHFLVGGPITAMPKQNLTEVKMNRLTRWQLTEQTVQHVWNRWRAEYLTTLQQRWKWQKKGDNISVGDLVVIHEENIPSTQWKLGRVSDLHKGPDNNIRIVTVKTATGMLKRPILKHTPILSAQEQDE